MAATCTGGTYKTINDGDQFTCPRGEGLILKLTNEYMTWVSGTVTIDTQEEEVIEISMPIAVRTPMPPPVMDISPQISSIVKSREGCSIL